MTKPPHPNTLAFVEPCKAEQLAAQKEHRAPRTSGVIARFRPELLRYLPERCRLELFEIAVADWMEINGGRIE